MRYEVEDVKRRGEETANGGNQLDKGGGLWLGHCPKQ
jgi:hypothetical protein